MLSETCIPVSIYSLDINMDVQNASAVKAYISREGKHISVLNENHVLSVFRYQPLSECELTRPVWEVENVRRLVNKYEIHFIKGV